MKKFIVADDHPLFREAICQVLQNSFAKVEIFQAEDILSLQQTLIEHSNTDLVLLDLHMPGAYGFGALAFIKGLQKDMPVLVVSANEKPEIARKAVQFGAQGFLPKSSGPEIISTVINHVLQGGSWLPDYANEGSENGAHSDEEQLIAAISALTPQQYLVLTMLAQGLLNKQIAYELDITEATVKAHMTAIFRKLGTRSRTQTALVIGKLDLEAPA